MGVWWKSAIGAVGVLAIIYTCGYLIEASYHSLLGISLQDPSKVTYLWSAADFVLDLLRSVAVWILELFGPIRIGILAVVVAALVAVAWRLRRKRGKRNEKNLDEKKAAGQPLFLVCIVSMVLLLGIKCWYLDLAAVNFEGLLLTSRLEPPDAPRLIEAQVKSLWNALICAREAAYSAEFCQSTRSDSRLKLEGFLVLNALLTIFVGVLCGVAYRAGGRNRAANRRMYMAGAVVVSVIGLLFFYGRTLRTLKMSKEVVVNYRMSESIRGFVLEQADGALPVPMVGLLESELRQFWRIPVSAISSLRREGVETQYRVVADGRSLRGFALADGDIVTFYDTDAKAERRLNRTEWETRSTCGTLELVNVQYSTAGGRVLYGFVMGETEGSVYLFEKASRRVWELSTDRIELIRIEGPGDVLAFHLDQVWAARIAAEKTKEQEVERSKGGPDVEMDPKLSTGSGTVT